MIAAILLVLMSAAFASWTFYKFCYVSYDPGVVVPTDYDAIVSQCSPSRKPITGIRTDKQVSAPPPAQDESRGWITELHPKDDEEVLVWDIRPLVTLPIKERARK